MRRNFRAKFSTKMVDIRDYNVVILGLSFMLIFTAFQTTSMIEASILKSASKEAKHGFHASGYNSLCIIYASFSLFNWIAPSVISIIKAKYSMIVGGICYWLFIWSLFFVSKYVDGHLSGLLYAASALLGFGAAVIWTAQGHCLTLNSTQSTMGRNSGIFWAFLQCSFLIGSLIVYYLFVPKKGELEISESERSKVLLIFLVLSGVGTLCFLFLRNYTPVLPKKEVSDSTENLIVNIREEEPSSPKLEAPKHEEKTGAYESFRKSVKLFFTKKMLLLNVCFFYTGLGLTFFSGVYGTCIGNTTRFNEPKRLIGLSGVFIGIGEILGGGIFGVFGRHISEKGKDLVVLLGMFVHFAAFFLILINLPETSPNDASDKKGYLLDPNVYVAILCSFLLGLGDSCFNTQIFSLLGTAYSDNSASAFAIFKFSQSVAAAIGFFYSTYLGLQVQLIILIVMAFFGTLSFFVVERSNTMASSTFPKIE